MLVINSLPPSLPNSCLVNLIDVTLVCEDANSKLVEVVAVACWWWGWCWQQFVAELRFGHNAMFLCIINGRWACTQKVKKTNQYNFRSQVPTAFSSLVHFFRIFNKFSSGWLYLMFYTTAIWGKQILHLKVSKFATKLCINLCKAVFLRCNRKL